MARAWWLEYSEPEREEVVLLQVDLGGHSAWLFSNFHDNVWDATNARTEFCSNLTAALERENFFRLFWAGDGGVFAAQPKVACASGVLCSAADRIFETFDRWRQDKPVELRVTATSLAVIVDREAGNWCSPDFNDFLKYERHLALPNSFVITETLKRILKAPADRQRLSGARTVNLPNGSAMTCYTDSAHKPAVFESPLSFRAWMRTQIALRTIKDSEIVERGLPRVGNCTLLDSPLRLSGYGPIVLVPSAPSASKAGISNEDIDLWLEKKKALVDGRASGNSLQITEFGPELSDVPHPYLACRAIEYVDARAFHEVLMQKEGATARYRSAALDVLTESGAQIPNILSTAILVIVGSEKEPELILANRRKLKKGEYDPNSWAVSIGEQFKPRDEERGGRKIQADASVEASIVRGLKEELLGLDFDGRMKISIHAFCLEDHIDNYMFVSIADLRPLSFDSVAKLWPEAVDHKEHDAIMAVPLTVERMRACTRDELQLTTLWSQAGERGKTALGEGISMVGEHGHKWQTNSRLRLALAWWWAESQASRQ